MDLRAKLFRGSTLALWVVTSLSTVQAQSAGARAPADKCVSPAIP